MTNGQLSIIVDRLLRKTSHVRAEHPAMRAKELDSLRTVAAPVMCLFMQLRIPLVLLEELLYLDGKLLMRNVWRRATCRHRIQLLRP